MAAKFQQPYAKMIAALHKVRHRLQGEQLELPLLTLNRATGGLDPLTTLTAEQWTIDTRDVGQGLKTSVFLIPEGVLEQADITRIHAVAYNGRNQRIILKDPPSGIQRYFTLWVQPVEPEIGTQ